MATKRGSLGQYRKWAGVDPEHASSVSPINEQSKTNDFQPWPQRRSSNEQMKNLQMRITEARQQSVYAHQRVADQIIQGDSQFNVFRKGESDLINKNSGFGSKREPSPRVYPWQEVSKTVDNKIADGGNPNEVVRPLKRATAPAINRDKYSNIETTSVDDISDDDSQETIPNYETEERNIISNRSLESKPPAAKKIKERNTIGKRSSESKLPAPNDMKLDMKDPAPPVKNNRKMRSSIVREIITPAPVKPNPHIEELSALTVDIIKLIDLNVSALGETNEKRKAVEFEKLGEVVEERRRQLREFLSYKYQGAALKLPMWKHKLGGNFDPSPESVLKGKGLFKVIVWSIIVMIVKPVIAVKKRKIERRAREQTDFARTLILYADATKSWISKGVRFPLSTLEQDVTLDFEPRQYQVESQASLFSFRMMQLKVRIKAIVKCVSSLEMPPDNITDFFISLVEEGNYFPPDFLWKCENDSLEFNSLGAITRIMVPVTDSEKITDNYIEKLNGTMSSSNSMRSSGFSEVLNDQNSDLNDTSPKSLQPTNKNFITLPGQPDQLVDVGRVRMLLQNFVLIRILVGHVLLSPWGSSICRKPSKRKNRIIYNCRMTATLIYEVVQKMDALKNLPPIGSEVRSPSVDQGFKTMTGRLSIKRTSSARKLKGNSMIEEQSTTVEEEPQSRMLLIFEKLFGLQSTKLELDDRKSSLERPRGEVEDQLLASRNNFEPLPTLHGYLLKPATLITARPLIDEWISGCSEALDDWMSKLVLHVLKRRAKRKERKIMAT